MDAIAENGTDGTGETRKDAAGGGAAPGHSPFASLLGDVAWLMVRSPAHRHLFLADLEWLVLPAL
ncbi:MAG: toxin-activating lysine-acyltransferase, partial [Alphaproteobacteria bacterium]